MGNSSSKLEKAVADLPEDERYYGLENFGNTCYCNSVLQALYFCRPFRERVLQFGTSLPKDADDNLLNCLVELFLQIQNTKKKTGVIPPKKFVQRLKRDNEQFCSYMHQDAHEFLNYLLNTMAEILEAQSKAAASGPGGCGGSSSGGAVNGALGDGSSTATNGVALPQQQPGSSAGAAAAPGGSYVSPFAAAAAAAAAGGSSSPALATGSGALQQQPWPAGLPPLPAGLQQQQPCAAGGGCGQAARAQPQQRQHPTWVHEIFQGWLVSETRCLQCETITRREESFMDLSLEIDHNVSLTACLKQFSKTEMLARANKFECEACGSYQEAERAIRIRAAPACLILHLKRFKFIEHLRRERKLMHRVVFPFELKLPNTTDDAAGRDALYSLFAVVVHVGSGPHHGHYVSLIKSKSTWLFFDDDTVDIINEGTVAATFGNTQEFSQHMDHGYILFYERVSP